VFEKPRDPLGGLDEVVTQDAELRERREPRGLFDFPRAGRERHRAAAEPHLRQRRERLHQRRLYDRKRRLQPRAFSPRRFGDREPNLSRRFP
jgi:hypothetical protein